MYFTAVNLGRRIIVIACLVLLILLACAAPDRLYEKLAIKTPGSGSILTKTAVQATNQIQTPTLLEYTLTTPTLAPAFSCLYSPVTAGMLSETSPERWIDWIEKLSGAEPVSIEGKETRITTRYSPAMFSANPSARAFDYLIETIRDWYQDDQVLVQDYTIINDEGIEYTWKNLIITLPGAERGNEIVILSAHLDSTSEMDPQSLAPGAEDNGSGTAALLEAARVFRGKNFRRTIQVVWFTGEEQGLLGSRAFVETLEQSKTIVGVVNLDMFGFDSDNDRCFELHVGMLPQSDVVGQCFIDSTTAYHLDLPRFDYLTDDATNASDHGRFWDAGIGAVEVLEDMEAQGLPNGCPASDPNPGYHSPDDTVDKINPHSGIAIVRAAIATISALAGPLE